MRKRAPIVVVAFCALLGVVLFFRRERDSAADHFESKAQPEMVRVALKNEATKEGPSPVATPTPTAFAPDMPEPKTVQHVFQLQLVGGKCTLEKVEEVSGAFHRERVPAWQIGMLCCRLLAGDGRIVAERTIQAPDYVCVVLDPNDESKVPTAARLTTEGTATFQVRFPTVAEAVRLEIRRINADVRPTDTAFPPGPLIASIDIPPK